MMLVLLEQALWAALPSLGFALIFNVPRSALIFCALGGTFTYGLRELLMAQTLSETLATLLASTCMGIVAVFLSQRFIIPRPVYMVAAIIPMIPGTYAYEMMISLVSMSTKGTTDALLFSFIDHGLHALSILFAIAFGLAIPSLYYSHRRKPVV